MSTQFDAPILDLDRTDERPVLDVVAYEASLAASVQSEALTVNVEQTLRRIAELEADIVATHETNTSLQKDLERRDAELAQLHGELVAARAEEQSQRALLKERTDELDALRRKLNEHETAIRGFEHTIRVGGEQVQGLMAQLRTECDERVKMSVKLHNARVRVKNLAYQVFGKDNRIAVLQSKLAVHTETLAAIQRDVSRIGDHADAVFGEVEHLLEPVGHEGPTHYLIGEVLTVGRTSDNDITIPSKLVSRRHARLIVRPTGVTLEDVNSMNGCYVNGEYVRQHLLQEGDVLGLGDLRYRLRTRVVGTDVTKTLATSVSSIRTSRRRESRAALR